MSYIFCRLAKFLPVSPNFGGTFWNSSKLDINLKLVSTENVSLTDTYQPWSIGKNMETHPLPLNFNWKFIDVPTFPWLRLPQGSRGNGLGRDLPKQGRSVAVKALRAQTRRQRSRVVQILQDDPMPQRGIESRTSPQRLNVFCFLSYMMIFHVNLLLYECYMMIFHVELLLYECYMMIFHVELLLYECYMMIFHVKLLLYDIIWWYSMLNYCYMNVIWWYSMLNYCYMILYDDIPC